MKIRLRVFSLLLCMSPAPTLAAEVTLNPDADSYVMAYSPTYPRGDWTNVSMGYDRGDVDALVRFDLSPYSDIEVSSAELQVCCFQNWDTPPVDNYLYLTANAWDEATVIWNNKPGYNTADELVFAPPSEDTWLNLDVTEFIEDWIAGTYPNYGFYMTQTTTVSGGFSFYSREWSGSEKPRLVIQYTGGAVETASWGAIKAQDN
ncbi:MAG: DNRLRE domain-containing protein [Candidatus Coatesbacteria bacterium]|nr:DNRLRE domain-containing protein [Candidatus Coatesbacteria bacterium]